MTKETISLISDIGIAVVTIGGTVAFFITLIFGGWRFLKSFYKTLKSVGAFMDKILPSVLASMERKKFISYGILEQWTKIVAQNYAQVKSPTQLKPAGRKLLKESGMQKIVDDNLSNFLEELKRQNLKSAYDVERNSFYVLKSLEEIDLVIPLKDYIFNNPGINLDSLFFVGSLYLRDEYLERHKELLEK